MVTIEILSLLRKDRAPAEPSLRRWQFNHLTVRFTPIQESFPCHLSSAHQMNTAGNQRCCGVRSKVMPR
jgi:hypothetical protein